jgi:CHAD domain-containing protein
MQLSEHIANPKPAILETVRTVPDCRTIFQRIAEGCVQVTRTNRDWAAAGDAEAIHVMRIEITRLRAAALFFMSATNDDAWQRIDRQLRWLNSTLGRARDRDVAVDYADRKRYRHWAGHSRRSLLRSQDKAHRRLTKELGSASYSRLTSELDHWISRGPSAGNSQAKPPDWVDTYCDRRLREWRNEISRQGRNIRALRRKPLHQLRIKSKNYRYMVDSLLNLDIPISREDFSFCETAKRVHQALGDLRDLRQLRKAVGRRPPHYRKRKRKLRQRVENLFRRL